MLLYVDINILAAGTGKGQHAKLGVGSQGSEKDVLNILIGSDGKVFIGTDNKNDVVAMLQTVTDKFGVKINKEQLKNFKDNSSIGVPLNMFSAYLSLEPEKMAEEIQKYGVPTDSIDGGMSEFQEWVAAAKRLTRT